MSDQIDINAISADVAQGLIKDLLKSTASVVSDNLRKLYVTNVGLLSPFIQSINRRIYYTRPLSSHDKQVAIEELYVPLKFKDSDHTLTDKQLITKIRSSQKLIVHATGGAGKTIFMKYVWIQMSRDTQGRIPVFFELRRLNEATDASLFKFLFHEMAIYNNKLREMDFEEMCREGAFIFLLDAFDELRETKREAVERSLIDFASRFPKCGIVVSSRPDDRLQAWPIFNSYRVVPLNLQQVKI